MLKRIGAEEGGEFKAVASGTLPCGKPVIVNADGTVSVVKETTFTESVGDAVVYHDGNSGGLAATYDTSNDKVVIAYQDIANNNYGTAIVGTVSGSSISFGTEVVFETANIHSTSLVFDNSNNKVIISYADVGNSDYGTSIVGTVSGTTISFGTAVVFNSGGVSHISSVFDTSANKVIIGYRDGTGKAIVGTVSGTSISFGSEAEFESGQTYNVALAYDTNANKTVIAYRDNSDGNKGKAVVGTVSGTSISFGSIVEFDTGNSRDMVMSYDSVNQKVLLVYKILSSPNPGYSIVGTVSGTSISFGTRVEFHSGSTDVNKVVYDSAAQKHVILFRDQDTSPYRGKIRVATISGTSVSYTDEFTWSTTSFSEPAITYDPDQEKVIFVYKDANNSQYGTARVYQTGYTLQNLTSENYIGMSRGVAVQTGDAAATGTATVYEEADSTYNEITYDTNSDKVVIAYKDVGNSGHGTAVVGTVSGTSISFGTPVVFESAESDRIFIEYDANSQKVVIVYYDNGNSLYGTAIVGTVSGTSISFGSPVVFDSQYVIPYSVTYDSSNQKVVVGYRRQGDTKGYVIVGTVSGTSISFGTAVQINNANTANIKSVYDTNAQKLVFVYTDNGSSGAGTSKVGTVSGTSISFGSATVFESGDTDNIGIAYDSDSQKIVVGYKDAGNSNYGTAIVGTVSGTSISFGTSVVFEEANSEYVNVVYDTNVQKLVISYKDGGNSNHGTLILGTVSGTSISFGSPTVFEEASTSYIGSVYDPDQQRTIISYKDVGNSNYGTAIVFRASTIATTRAEVADGGNASIDIIGSVSDNQIGLTAGQQYFVQTDGTIGETADSPSVLAGTAISATELLVKT